MCGRIFIIILISAFFFSSCNSETNANKNQSKSITEGIRTSKDPVFISHEGIAKAVTKQIWKEIVFGDYNVEDIKLFDLGKQSSKEGEKTPYQIITYGFQIDGDKEIFRMSLRADLKDKSLYYLLNEKEYYNCTEEEYSPELFSIEMKKAISLLVAEGYLKRKLIELDR